MSRLPDYPYPWPWRPTWHRQRVFSPDVGNVVVDGCQIDLELANLQVIAFRFPHGTA